jgi:hypothetical protein
MQNSGAKRLKLLVSGTLFNIYCTTIQFQIFCLGFTHRYNLYFMYIFTIYFNVKGDLHPNDAESLYFVCSNDGLILEWKNSARKALTDSFCV